MRGWVVSAVNAGMAVVVQQECQHSGHNAGIRTHRRAPMPASSNVALRIKGMELVRTRALICATCRHAVGGECGLDGRSLASHLGAAGGPLECLAGRQADEHGHVTRMGVKHVGVPWLERVWRWSEARDEGWIGREDEHGRRVGGVPGCGCVVVVKNAWLKMKGWGVAVGESRECGGGI